MIASMLSFSLTLADPRLLFIRHGHTHMNEYLSKPGSEWGAPNFVDPGLFDTELTPLGVSQASELNAKLRGSELPRVDALISSPLQRALHTSELAFAGLSISKRLVTPLAAERLFLSSDVGSPVAKLAARFDPEWRLRETLREWWWYQGDASWKDSEWRPPGKYLCAGEPRDVFAARMVELMAFLRTQCNDPPSGDESTICIIAHKQVVYALTGVKANNCECVQVRLSQLPELPWVEEDN